MKSVYIAAIIGAFAFSTVNANCNCQPTDNQCLSECGMF